MTSLANIVCPAVCAVNLITLLQIFSLFFGRMIYVRRVDIDLWKFTISCGARTSAAASKTRLMYGMACHHFPSFLLEMLDCEC